MVVLYSHTTYGNLNPTVNFDTPCCYIQFYLVFMSNVDMYHSYCVQALSRLFRINFNQIKTLQCLPFVLLIIAIQWIVGFFSSTSLIFSSFVQYIYYNHVCYIPFANSPGYVCMTVLLSRLLITLILIICGFIIRYTRRTKRLQQSRRVANNRDAFVLKRILVVISVSFAFSLPTTAIVFVYWITHQLIPMTYRLQVLCAALSTCLQALAPAYITSSIREAIRRQKMRTMICPT